MLSLAVFTVAGLLLIALTIGAVFYLGRRGTTTTVPGLQPIDSKDGNLADIAKAGSLHEFLVDLHAKYGGIASFWMGQQLVISISKPNLFQEQIGMYDRPPFLFKLFEPLFGAKSIAYAHEADGARERRAVTDKCHGHTAMRGLYPVFVMLTGELLNKWSQLGADDQIPLTESMMSLSFKGISLGSFGEYFEDDNKILKLRAAYDVVWSVMEKRLTDPMADAETERRFQENLKSLHDICEEMIEHRLRHPPPPDEYLVIDALIESDVPYEQMRDDAVTHLVAGFHTTGYVLTWAIYFIVTHPSVQERIVEELSVVLGEDEVDGDNVAQLLYLRQVLDETLRCAKVAPWAGRYNREADHKLDGHVIPAGTPVIQAFGVSYQDEEIWPNPNIFDPDRFSPKNSKSRHSLAFVPFGFAGKRKCPGYRFSYAEATTALAMIFRCFEIKLVGGQVVKQVFGLVTSPAEEVWIQIKKRKK